MSNFSLYDYTSGQLSNLFEAIGFDTPDGTPLALLRELLGVVGERPLTAPAPWPSDVADDATPVEFSVAFDDNGERAVRVLGEPIAQTPSHPANIREAERFLDAMAARYPLSTDRLDAVRDLFLPDEPQGKFAFWFSLILRPHADPKFKVYLNPNARGAERQRQLVADGLGRLGLDFAYRTAAEYALRRGELDRFSYFAIDLDGGPRARVKTYISHHDADVADVMRAATAVPGVDPEQVRHFCSLASGGETGRFTGLPVLSSYSFVEDDRAHPGNYSVYFPIRAHVPDDEVARDRLVPLMREHGFDPAELDRVLDAVARRPLADGVGLIAYVSLRLGRGAGFTVYLSSEAYGVNPPRRGAGRVENLEGRGATSSIPA